MRFVGTGALVGSALASRPSPGASLSPLGDAFRGVNAGG